MTIWQIYGAHAAPDTRASPRQGHQWFCKGSCSARCGRVSCHHQDLPGQCTENRHAIGMTSNTKQGLWQVKTVVNMWSNADDGLATRKWCLKFRKISHHLALRSEPINSVRPSVSSSVSASLSFASSLHSTSTHRRSEPGDACHVGSKRT